MAAQRHLVQPDLFLLEAPKPPLDQLGSARITSIYARQLFTKAVGSLGGHFDYSLNPYVGCGFACSYCFASFFQPEQERFDTWGKWIEIKSNAEALLRKKKDLKGARIFMSSATDPYQPLEGQIMLTRRLVELMSEPYRQPRLVVQTRGPLVTRDIDLLRRFSEVRVNMSITTDSDAIRRQFEPTCASIERRMQAIRQVKLAGIKTAVCISPMLPVQDPYKFAKTLQSLNADRYFSGFFHSSDRQFAANTRPDAWKLAESFGWDKSSFNDTLAILKKSLPINL